MVVWVFAESTAAKVEQVMMPRVGHADGRQINIASATRHFRPPINNPSSPRNSSLSSFKVAAAVFLFALVLCLGSLCNK